MRSTLLDAALEYAAAGWPVFPCIARSKVPAIKGGFYAATTNPETIRRYWRRPDCNIGIRTGAASGFWVFDTDGDEGEASLRGLESEHGLLPPTREAISGGGGRHLWFKYTGPVPSKAGPIGIGLDTRGDGGYIIAPPSIHPNGRAYAWSVDSVDELAIAPDWLLQLVRKRPAPTISERALENISRPGNYFGPHRQSDAYGLAALEDEITALAATLPGGRNHALNRAAFCLFQLVAGGELDRTQVTARLIDACHHNGLIEDDGWRTVMATIHSGMGAGLQHPRSRPGAT
jgi:Bifunctional DNA primase/polymerase, N-terminal